MVAVQSEDGFQVLLHGIYGSECEQLHQFSCLLRVRSPWVCASAYFGLDAMARRCQKPWQLRFLWSCPAISPILSLKVSVANLAKFLDHQGGQSDEIYGHVTWIDMIRYDLRISYTLFSQASLSASAFWLTRLIGGSVSFHEACAACADVELVRRDITLQKHVPRGPTDQRWPSLWVMRIFLWIQVILASCFDLNLGKTEKWDELKQIAASEVWFMHPIPGSSYPSYPTQTRVAVISLSPCRPRNSGASFPGVSFTMCGTNCNPGLGFIFQVTAAGTTDCQCCSPAVAPV